MASFAPGGGFLLALLRAGAVAGVLSAFGTLVFGIAVAPRALAGAPGKTASARQRALDRLCRRSLFAALVLGAAWLVAEAGQFVEAPGVSSALAATPLVLSGTQLGHAVAARLVVLAAALAVLGRRPSPLRWRAAALLCGGAVCLLAVHSHAAAMQSGPRLLLGAQVLHLLAAGAWLGGLAPLLLVVRIAPPRTAALACRWFTPLGKGCVIGIVVSACWQFAALISWGAALTGTAHGRTDAAKTLLLLALLGFAITNRYRLAPALLRAGPAAARRRLVQSLLLQTAAGLATIFVAAVLSGLEPAMHALPE